MAQNGLPNANVALTQSGDTITRPYYNFLLASSKSVNGLSVLTSEVATLTERVNSLPGEYVIRGLNSVDVTGSTSAGALFVTLANDAQTPGNTAYYGTSATGIKGWFPVAGALLGTGGNITLVTASNGVTTFNLAAVTPTAGGTLQKTAFDAYGRLTEEAAASTSDLPEGSNLYFTNSRADARIAAFEAGFASLTNAVNDAAAALAGVPVGAMYRNGSILQVRIS